MRSKNLIFMVQLLVAILFLYSCSDQNFVVTVADPLRVISVSPSDGSSGIALTATVGVAFSAPIKKETLNAKSFYIEKRTGDGWEKLEGEIAYNSKTNSAELTPKELLEYSQEYRIMLTQNIEKENTGELESGKLAISYESHFFTYDPEALFVLSSYPAHGSWEAEFDSAIKILFSRPVKQESVVYGSSLLISDITNAESPISGDISWNEAKTELLFTPSEPIGYSRVVKITLTEEVKTDDATEESGFLENGVEIIFSTLDPPPLVVDFISPSDKSEGIIRETELDSDMSPPILIYFSEGLNRGLIDSNGDGVIDENDDSPIKVFDISQGEDNATIIPVSISWLNSNGDEVEDSTINNDLSGLDSLVSLTPLSLLDYSSLIKVTLQGSDSAELGDEERPVKSDRATSRGGFLTDNISAEFRIEDPPPLSLVYAVPSGGALVENENLKRETSTNSGVATSFKFVFSEGVAQARVDANADGTWDTSDVLGALMVEEVIDGIEEPRPVTGTLVWLDEGETASGDTPTRSSKIGADYTVLFTPTDLIGYSSLVRFSLKGLDGDNGNKGAVFASDRATERSGWLKETIIHTYRVEDPPPLMIAEVSTETGEYPLRRLKSDGAPEGIKIEFSEGIARGQDNELLDLGLVKVEDITGLADPITEEARGVITGSLEWNNLDAPVGTDLKGSDNVVVFRPSQPVGYGTVLRITLSGDIKSDRATSRSGKLGETKVYLFSVETIPDLYLVSSSPSNGAKSVAINSSITLTFSEGIDCASLAEALSIAYASTDPTSASVSVTGNISPACADKTTAVTFVPSPEIKYSRDVTVTLTNVLKSVRARDVNVFSDALMGHLRNGYNISYSTIDPPALYVTKAATGSSELPMPRTYNGNADTITMEFSEGVARNNAELLGTLIKVEDYTGGTNRGAISGKLTWNAADTPNATTLIGTDNKAVFTPDSPIPYGTQIRVTLDGAAAPSLTALHSDRATTRGGQLGEDRVFDIFVEEIPDLTVISTSPSHSAENVPINQNFTIRFSEAIDCASFTSSVTVNQTGAWNTCGDGTTAMTYTFAPEVKYSVSVSVTITSALMSARAANISQYTDPLMGHLRSGAIIQYKTVKPPPLYVTSVIGSNGNLILSRDLDGNELTNDPEEIIITFSEGVDRDLNDDGMADELLNNGISVRDYTGGTDHGVIAGTLTWNASDTPNPSDLIGADTTVRFRPTTAWQWGTEIRVLWSSSLKSDRATSESGNLSDARNYDLMAEKLVPLYILKAEPGHISSGIAHDSTAIKVTFSQAPDCTVINSTSFSVQYDPGATLGGFAPADAINPGAAINGVIACVDGNPEVVFTAGAGFGYGRAVLTTLADTIQDARAAGGTVNPNDATQGRLISGYKIRFDTENLGNLIVTGTNFAGSTAFDRTLNLQVAFDKTADCTTVDSTTFFINRGNTSDPGNKLTSVITCVDGLLVVELNPQDTVCDVGNEHLCYDQEYTVTLGGGATGICSPEKEPGDLTDDGCIPDGGLIYHFTTQPRPALSVTISPSHNQTGVPITVKPSCTFTAPINTATVQGEPAIDPQYPDPDGVTPNICLIKGQNKTDCLSVDVVALDALNPYTFESGDAVVKINPAASLDPDTWYTVVVSRDIADKEGNRLTAFYTNSFKSSPGGLLLDITAFNVDAPASLYVLARFTTDIKPNTSKQSATEKTFYLTFTDEFGALRKVPAVVALENWDGGGICDPAVGTNCNAAKLTPDLATLFACDNLTYRSKGVDGSVSNGSNLFTSARTTFIGADIGRYIMVSGGDNPINNGSYKITGISGGKAVLDTNSFVSESELGWVLSDAPFTLPYNTKYIAHLSSLVTSLDDSLHVPASAGADEYLYDFSTEPDNRVESISYKNNIVSLSNLSGAEEVPVNADFVIAFTALVNPASLTAKTIRLEDARGTAGSVAINTKNFTVSTRGAFLAGRDEGKSIVISGSGNGFDGEYPIASITSDTTVVLTAGSNFSADESGLAWQKVYANSQLSITISPDGKEVTVNPTINLIYHADYQGIHASVAVGTNTVTIDSDKEIYRVNANRDLGKKIIITGSVSGNNGMRTITAVNQTTNAFTVDGAVFGATESNLRWQVTSLGDYHRLLLAGRSRTASDVITFADGNVLAQTVIAEFQTSPETFAIITPNTGLLKTYQTQQIHAVFTRDINFQSLSEDTFYITYNNVKLKTLFSYTYENMRTAGLIPIPYFKKDWRPIVTINELSDYRGNPINAGPHQLSIVDYVGGSSSTDITTIPSVSPAPGTIYGNQNFQIYFASSGTSGAYSNLTIPGGYNTSSFILGEITQSGSTGSAVATSAEFTDLGASFTTDDVGRYLVIITSSGSNKGFYKVKTLVSGTKVELASPLSTTESNISWRMLKKIDVSIAFVPGGKVDPTTDGDFIEIIPKERLGTGKSYLFAVNAGKIANLYTLAYNGTDPAPFQSYAYTVEAVAPTLSAVLADCEAGDKLAVSGRNDVKPSTAFIAWFNEAIDQASAETSITLTNNDDGSLVPASVEVSGNTVIVTPASPLVSNTTDYTLTFADTLEDAAGNKLSPAQSVTFDIETTKPTVVSTSPLNGVDGVAVASKVEVTMSEAVSPSSIFGATKWRDEGSFEVEYVTPPACDYGAEDDIMGCIALTDGGKKIVFTPVAPTLLVDNTDFTASLTTDVKDVAGNAMAAGYNFTFSTDNGDDGNPVGLCANLPLAVGEKVIEVYFNEALDGATVGLSNVIVYQVSSGALVSGSVTLGGADNNIVTFTADTVFSLGENYGIIVTSEITDVSDPLAQPLIEEYRAFFTGAG